MLLSEEITKLIAAAKALGAPLYGLDRFQAAAVVIEAEKSRIIAEHKPSGEGFFDFPETDDVDAETVTLVTATYAAWGFVSSRYLPAYVAEPFRGDLDEGAGKRANDEMRAGLAVVERWIGKL